MNERRPPGNVQLMKQLNREAILQYLREKGQLSRASLSDLTSLSKPSISMLVDELLAEGWLREVGIGESSGGRRPIMLEINSEGFTVIGGVFEGTSLALAAADINGEIVARRNVVIQPDHTQEPALDTLEKEILAILAEPQVVKTKTLGIGLGLPGVTRRGNGSISYSPSTGWDDLPIQQELEKRLGLPVCIENDVNLMALGELYRGAGKNIQNLIYMHVGTGIGAGVILQGQLFRGSTDAAGEIGYMIVGEQDRHFQGNYGIFESNYSSQAIMRKVTASPELRQSIGAPLSPRPVMRQLVEMAAQSPKARMLMQDMYLHWAYGLANMICILNPEMIILGGDMALSDEWGMNEIRSNLRRLVPFMPEIKIAQLGEDAGVIGAVFHVLETDRSLSGRLKNTMG